MILYFYIPKVMFFLFCFFVSRNHGRVRKDIPSAHHNSNNHLPSKQCNMPLHNTKKKKHWTLKIQHANVSNDHNLMLLSFRCPDTTRSRGWYTKTLNFIDMLMDCPSPWFAYYKCSTKIAWVFSNMWKKGFQKMPWLSNCQWTHGKQLWMKLLAPATWSALAVLCVAIDLHKVNACLSNVLNQNTKIRGTISSSSGKSQCDC